MTAMTKRNKFFVKLSTRLIVVAFVLLLVYEISFRYCLSRWGYVDTDTDPVSLFYAHPVHPAERLFKVIFLPREKVSLGKVRLSAKTRTYFEGGIFYAKAPKTPETPSGWVNMTEVFRVLKDVEEFFQGLNEISPEMQLKAYEKLSHSIRKAKPKTLDLYLSGIKRQPWPEDEERRKLIRRILEEVERGKEQQG